MTATVTAPAAPSTTPPTTPPVGRRGRVGPERTSWTATILLSVAALSVLVPLYVTVTMALKTNQQAVDGNAFSLPWPLSWDNFAEAWTLTNFPRALGVSVFITVLAVVGNVLLSSLFAFALARNWDRRWVRLSFYYVLAALFVPFPVVALPQVQLTGNLGLDNPVGVVALHIAFGLSFNTLLFTAFLRSVPAELEESARLDGATTMQTFWRLVFPLLGPMSATVAIFSFLGSWNDFMMPSLIIADPSLQTVPVVQKIFQTQFSSNYNISFASYLMAMAPAILAYVFTQRWVIAGVTQGAIK
jgi:raffinose/stachyose/melibiose transport system permease protein